MTTQIKEIIEKKFHPAATEFVVSIINIIYENEWGVAKEQLAMSLLKLSNGSLDKLLSYFPLIDPRDIIMDAYV